MTVSAEEERSLKPEYVRTMQVIHGAIVASAIAFFGVVVFLFSQASPNPAADTQMPNILSIIHGVLGSQLYGISWFLYGRHLKSETSWGHSNPPKSNGATVSRVEEALSRLRTASIIRLAMFEGVAFFGLVVCLLCAMSGVLHVQPLLWLNGLSVLVLIGLVALTFPTKERIISFLRKQI